MAGTFKFFCKIEFVLQKKKIITKYQTKIRFQLK